jgi:hypothetical protein
LIESTDIAVLGSLPSPDMNHHLSTVDPRSRDRQMLLIESVNLCLVSAAHRQAIHRLADAIASGL